MFVTRDGARVFFREQGAGDPPLVFIHGGAVDHTTWAEHMDHFAPKHRCVAMDLRGHGRSDGAAELTTDLWRDDVVAIMDEVQLRPAVLIGASRGGGIANRIAVDYPEKVKAVVMVDFGAASRKSDETPWARSREETQQLLAGYGDEWATTGARRLVDSWFPEPDVPESLKERLANMCRRTPVETVVAIRLLDVDETGREDYLRHMKQPTLILQSNSGRHLGSEQGRYIHERVPNSTLHYFEGRGHGFFMSAPEKFWARVEDFLEGVQ
ncbi:MAG TPA: alpha/beta hydrolase [Chloroflexota bacterium]